jgi:hypothetical protein
MHVFEKSVPNSGGDFVDYSERTDPSPTRLGSSCEEQDLGNKVFPQEFDFMSTIEPGMIPSDYLGILESFTNPLRLGSCCHGVPRSGRR